jgi:hypothetical protein
MASIAVAKRKSRPRPALQSNALRSNELGSPDLQSGALQAPALPGTEVANGALADARAAPPNAANGTAGNLRKPFSASFAELFFESKLAGAPEAARFEVSRALLIELLRPMFQALRFDPQWYQSAYPDLAAAHRAGTLTDFKAHYREFGFFEHRLPCFVRVDEAFYAGEYPDIGTAIAEGRIASPQWHFETFGFREGRQPSRGWRFADLVDGA